MEDVKFFLKKAITSLSETVDHVGNAMEVDEYTFGGVEHELEGVELVVDELHDIIEKIQDSINTIS
tara:strand:+ start:565 stop:762 length:198 start_codon:yes stop_codon:yes gene_type:complete